MKKHYLADYKRMHTITFQSNSLYAIPVGALVDAASVVEAPVILASSEIAATPILDFMSARENK